MKIPKLVKQTIHSPIFGKITSNTVKNIFGVQGKIALVTGSTGGLGFTFARGLAQHGASVILNGRNAEKLEARLRDLETEGLKASGYVFDVSRAEEVKAACTQIEKELGLSGGQGHCSIHDQAQLRKNHQHWFGPE